MGIILCKELIVSTLKTRGKGVSGDPVRVITEVYEKDGRLVAEQDPCTYNSDDLISFAKYCIENNYQIQNVALEDIEKWLNP